LYFELENFFKTRVQCVTQSAFTDGNSSFLDNTLSCPLFEDSIEGALTLYFVLCISTFQ